MRPNTKQKKIIRNLRTTDKCPRISWARIFSVSIGKQKRIRAYENLRTNVISVNLARIDTASHVKFQQLTQYADTPAFGPSTRGPRAQPRGPSLSSCVVKESENRKNKIIIGENKNWRRTKA